MYGEICHPRRIEIVGQSETNLEKTRLLLIKQQQSVTLVFINIVMLTGFQGMNSDALCQAATTLLHYFVLACFAWLTADQYFIFKSVVKTKPHVDFMKLFIAAWGFPVPFLIMQLLTGFLLEHKIGAVLYMCWGSDFVALTLLVPAGGLSVASIIMLSITVKSVIKRPAPTTYTRRKTDEAIKYGIKTSSVMIFVTIIVWIFAHLLFWYPENIDFQLIFALSTGLQGLFNFFFYCVFALELDIYVSDKLFSEADDVDEFARNTGSVKLSSINRQDIQNMESLRRPQKGTGSRPFFDTNQMVPPIIEEEPLRFHNGKSTPTVIRRLSDPLAWYLPSMASNAKKGFFVGNMPLGIAKREKKAPRQSVINEEEKTSCGDVIEHEPQYLLEDQATQRIKETTEDRIGASSPMIPGPLYTISGNRDKSEPIRCNSVPCSPPNYTSGLSLPPEVSSVGHRIRNEMSPTQELEKSFVKDLFLHGENSRSFSSLGASPKTDYSRKSVPSFKYGSSSEKLIRRPSLDIEKKNSAAFADDEETFEDQERKSLHYAKSGNQSRSGSNSGKENENTAMPTHKMTNTASSLDASNGDYGMVLPEDDGHGPGRSFNNKQFNDSANAFAAENDRNPTRPGFPSVDVKTIKSAKSSTSQSTGSLTAKSRLRPRPSVPSLKFALNELESLFSNQDLISAAGRRASVQSDSKTFHAVPDGASK
eukprot:gene11220-12398_t